MLAALLQTHVLHWVPEDHEPPDRSPGALYWARFTVNHENPRDQIVSYKRIWHLFGEGELIAWAGPIPKPLEQPVRGVHF
jgi:hypothetical protein